MKFKSVDIAGFRAYANVGDGIFNFSEANGSVSNFVAIYAPNGFGKSSFYDAMEWAITNNISRYIRDGQKNLNQAVSLHLNNDSSGQKILRNRYISDSEPAYVNVTTTENYTYQRKVRKAGPGQRDYTYDPNATDKTTKHLKDIFLSQDAIDAFLKEEKPELRYDKFMQDFGGEDEKYRSQLFALSKLCMKEVDKLTLKIRSLEATLAEPSLDFSVDQVNLTIEDLTALGSRFPKIDDQFSELEQTELQSMLTQRIVELENEVSTTESKRLAVYACTETVPKLEEQRRQRAALHTELSRLKENKKALERIKSLVAQKSKLDEKIKTLTQEVNQFESFLLTLKEVADSIKVISETKPVLTLIEAQIGQESIIAESNQQVVRTHEAARISLETTLASISDRLGKVKNDFQEIKTLEGLVSGYSLKKTELERNKTTTLSLQQALALELAEVSNESFSQTPISQRAIAIFKPDPQFVVNFSNYLDLKKNLLEKIREYTGQINKIGTQSKDFFNLLEITRSLLAKTHSGTCPICSAEYSSYAELLARIQSNEGIDSGLNIILKLKDEAEAKLVQAEDFIQRGIAYLDNLKATLIGSLTERQSVIASELYDLDAKIKETNFDLSLRTQALHRMKGEVRNLTEKEYQAFLEEQGNDTRRQIVPLEPLIQSARDKISESQRRTDQLLVRKIEAQTKIEIEENSETYLQYLNMSKLYSVGDSDFPGGFNTAFQKLLLRTQDVRDEVRVCEETKSALEKTTIESGGYSVEELLLEKIQAVEENLDTIDGQVSDIEISIRSAIANPSADLEAPLDLVNSQVDTLQRDLNIHQSALVLCNVLLRQLSDALPFIKFRAARDESQDCRLLIEKNQRLLLALKRDLRVVESRLKQRIDGFFYTDLITSIYRKIDPHPFFNTVKFDPVFPADEKPRLEVYLYEDATSLPISPSLYFSSAQLNILSLSIFLAKALHVEHQGKPVKAILIDDPIQSMDSINILSVIDLLRNISVKFDRQIILSTHDENFYELLKLKVPSEQFGSKFIKFKSFGVVVQD